MKLIPLLVGTPRPKVAGEPFRVAWEPRIIKEDEQHYIKESTEPGFSISILNTELLTNNIPLGYEPEMLAKDVNSLNDTLLADPILTATHPQGTTLITGMRINNIADIVHLDRYRKTKKVFETRFISTDVASELDLIRYNLNASGTRFIALRVYRTAESIVLRIREDLAGTGPTIAAPHVIMENPTGTVITDVIRFIVTANSLEVTLGNPRVPKGHYAFYGQKFPEEGAHLVLLKEGSSIIRQEDQVTYGVDGLVIYDE